MFGRQARGVRLLAGSDYWWIRVGGGSGELDQAALLLL